MPRTKAVTRPTLRPPAPRAGRSETRLAFEIQPQPDETTCGPTCLHSVYAYYGDHLPLSKVISEVHSLEGGGTLTAMLGCHALRRAPRRYRATIYTYNLRVFDPTWFSSPGVSLRSKLKARLRFKTSRRFTADTRGYIEFLDLGGEIRFEDLTPNLIRAYLARGTPVLTGLSATYLYHSARECGPTLEEDDIRGSPQGHFVVLHGYNARRREVLVADPQEVNPAFNGRSYVVGVDRLIGAILLGMLTYDATLLIIEPHKPVRKKRKARAARRAR